MEGSEDAYVGYMTIRVRISNFSRAFNNFILMPEQLNKYYVSVLSSFFSSTLMTNLLSTTMRTTA